MQSLKFTEPHSFFLTFYLGSFILGELLSFVQISFVTQTIFWNNWNFHFSVLVISTEMDYEL